MGTTSLNPLPESSEKDISLEDFIRAATRGLQTEQNYVAEVKKTVGQGPFIIGLIPYPPLGGTPPPAPYSGGGSDPKTESYERIVGGPKLTPINVRLFTVGEAPPELVRQQLITQDDAAILLQLTQAGDEAMVAAAATEVTSPVGKQIVQAIMNAARVARTQQSQSLVARSSSSGTKHEVEWSVVAGSALTGAASGGSAGFATGGVAGAAIGAVIGAIVGALSALGSELSSD